MEYLSFNQINEISKKHALNIFSSNVQSLAKHFDEVTTTIKDLKYPEIIGLSELWNPPENLLDFNLYQKPIVKLRGNRSGGGVALFVRSGIRILKRDTLDYLNLSCVEAISVTIQIQHKTHTIVNIYKPPLKPSTQTIKELRSILELYSNQTTTIIGDTNIDYFQTEMSLRKNYKELLDEYFFNQCVKLATRITNKSHTLIDHTITNCSEDVKANVLIHSTADHQSVFTSIYPKKQKITQKVEDAKIVLIKESITSIEQNIDWNEETKNY